MPAVCTDLLENGACTPTIYGCSYCLIGVLHV